MTILFKRIKIILYGGFYNLKIRRCQLLARYSRPYCELLNFSKEAHDRIALQQIKERRAMDLVNTGNISAAIDRCKSIWASFPGAGYGQREHRIDDLLSVYTAAGGVAT